MYDPIYFKEYYKKNRAKKIAYKRAYDEKNRELVRARARKYRKENLETIISKARIHYRKNKEVVNKEWYAGLLRRPDAYFIHVMRSRIRGALLAQRSYKCNKTTILLGAPIKDVKKYLESKFVKGMSWDNWGDWHIDHIRPLASFNLKEQEEQKKAFHFSNLQPLWAKENQSKSAKYVQSSAV